MRAPALLVDLYELTMMEGYFQNGLIGQRAVFDVFFRYNPFGGGYSVFAGIEQAAEYLTGLSFAAEEIDYLESLGLFSHGFLEHLKSFRFTGSLYAFDEGSVVFPEEPIARIEAPLGEAQLVESVLLNILNFQTLIATKAARICRAAGGRPVVEFGLRRAQGGDGALSASRAAYIGGCEGTSNVLAGARYGIPVRGTHAHSWVMAFDDELSSFRAYADTYPDGAILLVDTYDSRTSGIPNAIRVARELELRGYRLAGIRLDSGDPLSLCRMARNMLDEAGLGYVKIVLSNELDEYVISDLVKCGVPADVFGVGTRLATGHGEAALSGVYKIAALEKDGFLAPKLKMSDDLPKGSLPGRKEVERWYGDDGRMLCDVIHFGERGDGDPLDIHGKAVYAGRPHRAEKRLRPVVVNGGYATAPPSIEECRSRCWAELESLPEGLGRLDTPEEYPVLLDPALFELRRRMIAGIRKNVNGA